MAIRQYGKVKKEKRAAAMTAMLVRVCWQKLGGVQTYGWMANLAWLLPGNNA